MKVLVIAALFLLLDLSHGAAVKGLAGDDKSGSSESGGDLVAVDKVVDADVKADVLDVGQSSESNSVPAVEPTAEKIEQATTVASVKKPETEEVADGPSASVVDKVDETAKDSGLNNGDDSVAPINENENADEKDEQKEEGKEEEKADAKKPGPKPKPVPPPKPTPEPETEKPTEAPFQCPTEKDESLAENTGLFPDPKDCNAFYQCSNGLAIRKRCPATLVFDSAENVCNYPNETNMSTCTLPTPPPPPPSPPKVPPPPPTSAPAPAPETATDAVQDPDSTTESEMM